MFNPHIHHQQQQQQQQQQQFHQHLRQIQQLLQQQPPPPPPQPPPQHHVAHHHHHQAPRPMPSQTAPSPRMVNLCQATQTTIIAPNPMLQGALLMQQMQGNMRGFAMGGQQFRQFFSAGARSSLLGPVPMGMTMKSPLMGYPAARHYHPHPRFYNNINNNHASTSTSTDYRQPDRKRDNEQRAAASANGQSATSITANAGDKGDTAASAEAAKSTTGVVDLSDEPAVKKPRTEGSEEQAKQTETIDLDSENPAEDAGCTIVEDVGSTTGSEVLEGIEEAGDAELDDECLAEDAVLEEAPADPDAPPAPQDGQDDHLEGTNKFYCYLCSITCHSQQNFRSHMNGVAHQQRMMEVQHMSNAGLVTLLPRMQESLLAAQKDGEKRAEPQHWCPSCGLHLTCGATDHRCNKEHQQLGSLAGPTCTVCKKTFKSPRLFVEHMRSQEHRHRVEEEKQRFGALSGLDSEDLQRDHQDGIAVEGEEERDKTSGSYQLDDLSARTEVTLESMSVDEEYKANTAYGSRFLVPVAGFLCRLCNRFYHFESSALHSHCKSLTHFEHLKKHKSLKSSQQDGPPATSGSEDRLRPVSELECSDGTANPAASSDPDQPGPPAEPQESPSGVSPAAASHPVLTEEEEEEEQLLSHDASGQPAGAGPEADCNQAEPAAAPMVDEEPSGTPLAEEEPAGAPLAEEEPADAPLAEEEPADAPLAEVAPADAPLAAEAPEPAPPSEEAPAEEGEEAGAVGEAKGAPQKKTSTGKAKATPKRRSKRR